MGDELFEHISKEAVLGKSETLLNFLQITISIELLLFL